MEERLEGNRNWCEVAWDMPSRALRKYTKRRNDRKLRTTRARSLLMSRVRQHGTDPELMVRRLARRLGRRLSTNVRTLPGSPDLVQRATKKAIFVHGCFWHRHPGCTATTTPANNREFWVRKFAENIARDARKTRNLRRLGYDTIIIWSCELRDRDWEEKVGIKLTRFLNRPNRTT
jgi:DNA mismatch endonuclease, patch repair protein